MNDNCSSRGWFALRRTLPPFRFDEGLAELLQYVVANELDEVIVKVDTEDFSHGHPSLGWLQAYQSALLRLRDELAQRGVAYSVNPWITFGHCDRGRDDLAHMPGLQTVVGHDGTVCRHCACPLSEVWREHIGKLWTIYAETLPRVLWVEDDIRTWNHEPVEYGCFCPKHLERFSTLAGRRVEREELAAALLQPGKPHPWRRLYLQMQQEIMVDTAAFLARTVHRSSPETSLGLMSSGPRNHCLEGRDWQRFAAALGDGKPLYSRPALGCYFEYTLRDLFFAADSIKLTRHVMPPNTIELTEVECAPYFSYANSARFNLLKVAVSLVFGAHGVTMNLFDHLGSPLATEAGNGGFPLAELPFLREVAASLSGRCNGVQLLHCENSAEYQELKVGQGYQGLIGDGLEMMYALEHMGIPTCYEPGPVAAASGQHLRALRDEDILKLLQAGLLLDAVAARVLCERGFAKYLGLESCSETRHRREFPFVIAAEAYNNPEFGGGENCFLTASLPFLQATGHFAMLRLLPECRAISWFVDADRRPVMPAMTAYTNELGGRVVVHALDYAGCVGVAYDNPFRRRQLHAAIRFLAQGKPALLCTSETGYPLAFRRDADGESVIGVFNLNLDDWHGCGFELAWEGPGPVISRLSPEGHWYVDAGLEAELCDGVLRLNWRGTLDNHLPLVLKLKHTV